MIAFQKIVAIKSIPRIIPIFNHKFLFSDVWKNRQQSAQKVYITQRQKKVVADLLYKIENQEVNAKDNQRKFIDQLNNILKYQDINNQAFKAEIINLHKQL